MKALIIFSLFIICYIHSEDTQTKILIYGFDNIDIKDNEITFNVYTNEIKNLNLELNQGESVFGCECQLINQSDICNFSCYTKDFKLKTNERLSIEKGKNKHIDLNTYASAQGKNLKRAEENKFSFDYSEMDRLINCYNATGENPMPLINCKNTGVNVKEKDINDNATFYVGDDSSKIAIPSKITQSEDDNEKKIQIELSPHNSFINVSFDNIIGVSNNKQKKIYLLEFDNSKEDRFNFTYISKKNSPKKKGNKLSAGAILAIIIPSVLAIAAVIAIIILLASKSGAPVATSAPNPQTYNTLGLNSSSSVNKN